MLQKVYRFRGIEDLYSDEYGHFYFKSRPAKKILNNGVLAILAGRSKHGLKKLRRLAYVSFIEIEDQELPF